MPKENIEVLIRIATVGGLIGIVIAAILFGHFLLFRVLEGMARRTARKLDDSLIRHLKSPARWLFLVIGARLMLDLLGLSDDQLRFGMHILGIAMIGVVSWLLIRITGVIEEYVESQFNVDVRDNLRARSIHTQMRVMKRIVVVIVAIIALSCILMTFDKVRQLGASMLTSAGIAGLVVGIAAQKTLATFIAGLQIAFTQPIRIDDVVIVENEYGRVEEITLTYVVVRVWDQRRLIIPITYFIERPFQNWTRVSAELLGTVLLYVDYTIPLEPLRTRLHEIVESSSHWDRRVCALQITNATDRTMELRALVSAADSSSAWELRCLVREQLLMYIQEHYPSALPHLRAELDMDLTPAKTANGPGIEGSRVSR